jgi:pyruvate/2-oxoglutarate dehydrogenase complex dihydrolipoamide acyltransferase (E2) component
MIAVKIPKLGLTMESATVARWTAGPGAKVRKDEVILVIETDKVTYEVTAPEDGIIHPIVPEGSLCAVEQVVAYLASDMEEYKKLASQYPTGRRMEETAEKEPQEQERQELTSEAAPRIKASPLARAMAKEHGLDLSVIKGTGPGGRVVRADILSALERRGEETVHAPSERKVQAAAPASGKTPLELIPVKGARKVIFDNMFMSLSASAQLTIHTEASAEALITLRKRLEMKGDRPSYNAVLVKTAASVLRRHPRLNATVSGSDIILWKELNIGLAMESGDFLVVPVIRDPDKKGIMDIDAEIKALTEKARKGGLTPDDMAGGTFTITNLGFADIDLFTPIIRPPESAILGVGRIVKKPWVREEALVAEYRVGLSLTFDHRIIDGAPAARFLKELKDAVEEPLLLLG